MESWEATGIVIGVFLCILIVKLLKRSLKQPRPEIGSTYGMPSTRATLLYFVLIFCVLSAGDSMSSCTIGLLCMVTFVSCISKYILREHSIPQLLAGAGLGCLMGLGIFQVASTKGKRWLNK